MVKLGYQVIKLSLFSFQVEIILLCDSIFFNWFSGSTFLKRMQFRREDWAISKWRSGTSNIHGAGASSGAALLKTGIRQDVFRFFSVDLFCFKFSNSYFFRKESTETFRFQAQERGDNVIKRFCPVAPSLSEMEHGFFEVSAWFQPFRFISFCSVALMIVGTAFKQHSYKSNRSCFGATFASKLCARTETAYGKPPRRPSKMWSWQRYPRYTSQTLHSHFTDTFAFPFCQLWPSRALFDLSTLPPVCQGHGTLERQNHDGTRNTMEYYLQMRLRQKKINTRLIGVEKDHRKWIVDN